MSEDTTFTQFKRRGNPLKAIGAWLGIAACGVGLTAGFSKLYYETPLTLKQHEKKIERLEATDSAMAETPVMVKEHEKQIGELKASANAMVIEQRSQRDILLEIRGDIKVLNKQSRP